MALGEEGFHAISQGPLFAKCHVYGTRRSLVFAKCQTEALGEADGKGWGWMPSGFAKCLSSPSAWHLAKRPFRQVRFFAKCPIFGTRRTLGHLAKPGFPVVNHKLVQMNGERPWAFDYFVCTRGSRSGAVCTGALCILYPPNFFSNPNGHVLSHSLVWTSSICCLGHLACVLYHLIFMIPLCKSILAFIRLNTSYINKPH